MFLEDLFTSVHDKISLLIFPIPMQGFALSHPGYLTLQAGTFTGGDPKTGNINFSFHFRTQFSDGLLYFAYGGKGSYFLVQLVSGELTWTRSNNGIVQLLTYTNKNVNVCDGQWHYISLTTIGAQMTAFEVSQSPMSIGDPTQAVTNFVLASPLFVGGPPPQYSDGDNFILANNLETTISRSTYHVVIFSNLLINECVRLSHTHNRLTHRLAAHDYFFT